ncbi:MAG: hypothetical protein JKY88_13540 [Pseudomonadales bacterium]|nr:hypothetical protein [Pseudomonadales bacterium]
MKIIRSMLLSCSVLTTTIVQAESAPKISIGNGENNWIITEGVKRNGSTLTFSEVNIDGDGWLVMHPFENGAPNGDKYVAATFVENGVHNNVEIKVHKGISKGEMFIVMLHKDSNQNKIFDFVFIDEINVMDRAVFEGNTMIGHAIAAP